MSSQQRKVSRTNFSTATFLQKFIVFNTTHFSNRKLSPCLWDGVLKSMMCQWNRACTCFGIIHPLLFCEKLIGATQVYESTVCSNMQP
jgi:hypothetical protein